MLRVKGHWKIEISSIFSKIIGPPKITVLNTELKMMGLINNWTYSKGVFCIILEMISYPTTQNLPVAMS